MSLLLDSIRESELREVLSALVVKMEMLEKEQEKLTKRIDGLKNEEYNVPSFRVNERNDC